MDQVCLSYEESERMFVRARVVLKEYAINGLSGMDDRALPLITINEVQMAINLLINRRELEREVL